VRLREHRRKRVRRCSHGRLQELVRDECSHSERACHGASALLTPVLVLIADALLGSLNLDATPQVARSAAQYLIQITITTAATTTTTITTITTIRNTYTTGMDLLVSNHL